MFRSIWQIIRGAYTRRRSGIDKANINHLRADLRFQLAMVEYAYFGRSSRRVARCLSELKSVLGDKAVHRYLRSLDPDLRTQFVERFQGARRNAGPEVMDGVMPGHPEGSRRPGAAESMRTFETPPTASNVVPINQATRRPSDAEPDVEESGRQPGSRSADSSD